MDNRAPESLEEMRVLTPAKRERLEERIEEEIRQTLGRRPSETAQNIFIHNHGFWRPSAKRCPTDPLIAVLPSRCYRTGKASGGSLGRLYRLARRGCGGLR